MHPAYSLLKTVFGPPSTRVIWKESTPVDTKSGRRLMLHKVYLGRGHRREMIFVDCFPLSIPPETTPEDLKEVLPEGPLRDWSWCSCWEEGPDLWVEVWREDPPERVRAVDQLIWQIQQTLRWNKQLLKKEYRCQSHPLQGHCYVAAETLYHMTRDTLEDFKPCRGKDATGRVHWWLQDAKGRRIDPTFEQYTERGLKPPYEKGRRAGFLTRLPSKRTRELIELVQWSIENPIPADPT